MSDTGSPRSSRPAFFFDAKIFGEAFKYSIPVLLGYVTLGTAFGLMVSSTGYPWWLALVMSSWIYAGAGQFIALGLFAVGTSLWQACLIQFVVNIRHAAYGLSMLKRFHGAGVFKPYLVFALTDETFALLSSLPEISDASPDNPDGEGRRRLFMVYLSGLDQSYWLLGTVIGAVAGAIIPFEMKGVSFALTALFVVLMIEQVKKVKKPPLFIVSAVAALLGVFLLPGSLSILAALAGAFLLIVLCETCAGLARHRGGTEEEDSPR
jgi:4-azaleucine resistance transporter AzlC